MPRYAVEVADALSERSRVGLCLDCKFMREMTSDRGSTFYLCERSAFDPEFPKYPLPSSPSTPEFLISASSSLSHPEGPRFTSGRRDLPCARIVPEFGLHGNRLRAGSSLRLKTGNAPDDTLDRCGGKPSEHSISPSRYIRFFRIMSSAMVEANRRIRLRSPGKLRWTTSVPLSLATAWKTRPTGLSGVPPDGPATPVTPTPMLDSQR